MTSTFQDLYLNPFQELSLDSPHFLALEKFVINLYSRACTASSLNEARKEIFAQKSPPMENLPPTRDALLWQAHRGIYQTGIYSSCLKSKMSIPSPEKFGWCKTEDSWQPYWTSLPEVSESCRQLLDLKCSCKKDKPACTSCNCCKENVDCTAKCSCPCPK